jgi:sugar diacid utilization regulator
VLATLSSRNSNHRAEGRMKKLVADVCKALEERTPLVAVVSAPCKEPDDYQNAFAQAKYVLDGGLRPDRDETVTAVGELGSMMLFLDATRSAEALSFSNRILGSLQEYPGRAPLLDTLNCYFSLGHSVRAASRELDVHENTIRYRLTRVQELTGLNVLADPADQLDAQLALLILRRFAA